MEVGGLLLDKNVDGALGGVLEAQEAVNRGIGVAGGRYARRKNLAAAVPQPFNLKIRGDEPATGRILLNSIAAGEVAQNGVAGWSGVQAGAVEHEVGHQTAASNGRLIILELEDEAISAVGLDLRDRSEGETVPALLLPPLDHFQPIGAVAGRCSAPQSRQFQALLRGGLFHHRPQFAAEGSFGPVEGLHLAVMVQQAAGLAIDRFFGDGGAQQVDNLYRLPAHLANLVEMLQNAGGDNTPTAQNNGATRLLQLLVNVFLGFVSLDNPPYIMIGAAVVLSFGSEADARITQGKVEIGGDDETGGSGGRRKKDNDITAVVRLAHGANFARLNHLPPADTLHFPVYGGINGLGGWGVGVGHCRFAENLPGNAGRRQQPFLAH